MNNSTTIFHDKQQYRTVYNILLFSVLIFSTIGNVFVMIAQCLLRKRSKKLINLLVSHLATCDLLMVMTSIPIDLMSESDKAFLVSPVGCKIVHPLATYAITIGTYTMLAIAYERWKVVATKLYDFSSARKKCGMFLAIHTVGLASVIPYVLTLQFKKENLHDDRVETCTESWGIRSRRVYTLVLFLVQYAIPVPLMLMYYTRAWMVVKESNRRLIHSLQKNKKGAGNVNSFSPAALPAFVEVDFEEECSEVFSDCIQTDLSTISSEGCSKKIHHIETITFLGKPSITCDTPKGKKDLRTWLHRALVSKSSTTSCNTRPVNKPAIKPSSSMSESKGVIPDSMLWNREKRMSTTTVSRNFSKAHSSKDTHNKMRRQSMWKKARNLHDKYFSVCIDPNQAQGRALQQRFLQTVNLLKTFSLIAIIFVIFLLPNQILWLWMDFKEDRSEHLNPVIADVTYLLTYVNCVFNPIIYGGLNRNIPLTFKRLFKHKSKLLE